MNLQRVEEIEKIMDELEVELESLSSHEDQEYAKKRSSEIIEESHKLSEEMLGIFSQVSESLGIDLSEFDTEEEATEEKGEE